MPLVRAIFLEHRRRYGARRIAAEMTARGRPCGPARVARLMKAMGLVAIQPRSFRPRTTRSRHHLGYSPHRLLDAPPPAEINRVWVGDITYLPLKTGRFAYLALLMDLCSRRIVGLRLDDHMTEPLVLDALRDAIAQRQPAPGLIHHTDRGGQYAGRRYRATLARAAILQSMSRPNNCYDNAFIESCFGTIKRELDQQRYDTMLTARAQVADYVTYYNVRRRHSSIGYRSPLDFERQRQ